MSSGDRALLNAFKEINQMADRLNLPKMVAVSILYPTKSSSNWLNPLPGDKVLDWSKLKQIAADILKCI